MCGFAIDLLILFSCSVVSLWNWLEAEIPLTRRFVPTAEQQNFPCFGPSWYSPCSTGCHAKRGTLCE